METQEALKALRANYSKRPKCEKHLTFEQFIKLESLRMDTEKERAKKTTPKGEDTRFKVVKGDRVYITADMDGKPKRLSGYVQNITKTGKYLVATALGEFIGDTVTKREPKKDLSAIVVPEQLKKLSTKRLVSMFKSNRFSEDGVFMPGVGFISIDVVKAELNTREHVLKEGEKSRKSTNIK